MSPKLQVCFFLTAQEALEILADWDELPAPLLLFHHCSPSSQPFTLTAVFHRTSANPVYQPRNFFQIILVVQHFPRVFAQPGAPQAAPLPTTP